MQTIQREERALQRKTCVTKINLPTNACIATTAYAHEQKVTQEILTLIQALKAE